jgi:syntaxin 5
LGTLFGKMSTLLSQQAEVVDKVEDDVEAAMVDVAAGHDEITTLYSIKKGNRALIIKVFAILIFFIIFMRIYKK